MPGTWEKIREKNYKYLSDMGNVEAPVRGFARIRSFGDKNSAVTFDGQKVERQEYLFAEGYGMVRCLPTTMHFIYEDASKKIGRWVFMCSCGSIAGIVSYKEMSTLISPELGEYVLACIAGLSSKQNTGIFRHADGSTE